MTKIKLKETPEQIELIRAIASSNKLTSAQAQEAFAAFIGPVAQKVLAQAGTTGLIYSDFTYDEDDSPSIPLDLYYGASVDYIQVWSQNMAGGLPSSHVSGTQELKIATYRLDSAVNVLKKYARRARLDVISAAISRMIQEVLVKQERNGWAVILKALGEASTNGTKHTIASSTQNVLQVDDFNRLMTLSKRLNVSFANGTPDNNYSNGITDLFLSPEMKEQIRSFAYQPMNTRIGAQGTAGTPVGGSTAVPLPDSIREEIYRSAGVQEIYGVSIHELNELGTTQKYNQLFSTYAQAGIANGGGTFSAATDEILIGVDLTKDAFRRPLAKNADSGATFVAQADDQWVTRSEKVGWYGSLEEGRICLDARAIQGLVV
jgi:hypothetical protein